MELQTLQYSKRTLMRTFDHMHNKTGDDMWADMVRGLGGITHDRLRAKVCKLGHS